MRVSVVIPSYEAGSLLLGALASVQSQQRFTLGQDLEVLVADDGSARPDSAQAMAAAAAMPGVRVLRPAGRTGPSAARNLAAAHAQGEWLAFLDADDVLAPDALQRRLALGAQWPDAQCIGTDYAEFPAGETPGTEARLGVIASTASRRIAVQQAYDERRAILLDRPVAAFMTAMPLWTGAVMVRRVMFDRLGGFPVGHFIGEDLHLWMRLAAAGPIAFLPDVTAYCRKGHLSLTASEPAINLKTTRCFESLVRDPLMITVLSRLRAMIAQGYCAESYFARQAGHHRAAVAHALRALRWQPATIATWRALVLAPFRPRHAEPG